MPAHDTEDRFSKSVPSQRKPARNSYLVKYDGRSAIFRTPRWRTILALSLAVFLCGFPALTMAASIERWGRPDYNLSVVCLPLILFGICLALSSGASEVAFDLNDRTYRRVLLPPTALFGKRTRNLTGAGNPLGGRIIEGEMTEIDGIQLVEGRGNNSRLYSIQAVWADRKYQPCVVNFLENADEARDQVLEIAAMLHLPVLEPSLLDDPPRLRSRWG